VRNVALAIAYDGTHFAGFQRQMADRSVQGVLEEALSGLTGESPQALRLVGAGRTDAGVHASGMVVNFRTTKGYPDRTWVEALNARLPEDLAVQAAREVDEAFHSRFSAIARSYRYDVVTRSTPDPLRRHTVYRLPRPLAEPEAMSGVWRDLVGTWDFAAFGSTNSTPRGTVITVFGAGCRLEGDVVSFEIEAQSFLYHMVRRLVGAALEVGRGRLSAAQFAELYRVAASERLAFVPPTAPASGLHFVKASYPPPWAELFGPF